MSIKLSQSVAPAIEQQPVRYSPGYPWAETGVVLFLVLMFGIVIVRWLPGYLRRREAIEKAARDAEWLSDLRREESDRLLRDTLLSKHLNLAQIHLDDLQATQESIAGLTSGQKEIAQSIIRSSAVQAKLLKKSLARLDSVCAILERVADGFSAQQVPARREEDSSFTRLKGVGQSPNKSVYVENTGIDL